MSICGGNVGMGLDILSGWKTDGEGDRRQKDREVMWHLSYYIDL